MYLEGLLYVLLDGVTCCFDNKILGLMGLRVLRFRVSLFGLGSFGLQGSEPPSISSRLESGRSIGADGFCVSRQVVVQGLGVWV